MDLIEGREDNTDQLCLALYFTKKKIEEAEKLRASMEGTSETKQQELKEDSGFEAIDLQAQRLPTARGSELKNN